MAQEQLQMEHPITLGDWAGFLDPEGKIGKVHELLNQTNRILDDAVYVQGNLPTGHVNISRADIPRATWRRLNYGVKPVKSVSAQVTDTSGMLEQYSEVDKKIMDLNGNTAEFRLTQDRPIIEGMNQDMVETLFYGSTVDLPESFLGLSPRYDDLNAVNWETEKPAAFNYMDQIISAGGSASNALTSLWLIVWGANTVYMFFPKGTVAGLTMNSYGEETLRDPDGGMYQGYRSHYKWETGLCVADWRYVVRIANIDPADPQTELDYKDMIQAINTIPNLGMGKPVFYCNRTVKTKLDIAAAEKTNAALRIVDNEHFGQPQTMFWGIPIKQCDGILNTEAEVVAST